MKYETIINDLSSREELINRVEVLDRVKRLLLIPELQFTTLQGVAEFYEVDNKAISSLVNRHREELNSDGLTKISRGEALSSFLQNEGGCKYTVNNQYVRVFIADKYSITIGNSGSLMFPKRAILRVGMLLRDSNIAQEVRTQLLNIEQRTSSEAKIVDIDNEKQLLEQAVGAAFIKNNNGEFLTVMKELIDYSNRYATEAYKAIENENAELKDNLREVCDLADSLQLTNKALSEQISTVTAVETYRRVIITMMLRLAAKKGFRDPFICYTQLYTVLRNNYEIDLTGRRYKLAKEEAKSKSKIDCLETKDEWNKALKIATAMCYHNDVMIDDLLRQMEKISDENL